MSNDAETARELERYIAVIHAVDHLASVVHAVGWGLRDSRVRRLLENFTRDETP